MQADWTQQSNDRPNGRDVHVMTDDELNAEIRHGMDDWCDLLDDLIAAGGMLPTRDLAGRVVDFFEDEYWRVEEARVEVLRRQMADRGRQRRCVSGWSGGIR